jgi:2-polyprenyl-3-methyl-5-hydroxy-6-metoxy-1,4-benzoquinol methylase
MAESWEKDQEWEANWWGDCLNIYGEETKQRHYAKCMGLAELANSQFSFFYDLAGASVLDIGGGPTSLLLKCINRGRSMVLDPLQYPEWVYARYEHAGIEWDLVRGEDVHGSGFVDEVWIYNVLQHVIDPAAIIANAKRAGKIIRLFEWLEIGVAPGHPHNLLEEQMNEWLGGSGKVNANVPRGKEYYGIFLGDNYEGN